MSCGRYRQAIAAHAAGGELDARAAAHVGSCPGCQRLLDRQRGMLAELDAHLQGSLAITASPDFTARVTSAARIEPAPKRIWLAASWSAGAVAATVAFAVYVGWLPPSGGRSLTPVPPALVTEAVPPQNFDLKVEATHPTATRPRADLPRATRHEASGPVVARREGRVPRHAEPAVIVDPQRALAIARLRELMLDGRLDGRALPPERTPEAASADLAIAPLEVEEIKVPPLNKESGQ